MADDYRIRKISFDMNDALTNDIMNPNPYHEPHIVTRYVVQVRGFLWWHTVKVFKKIRPAARLLHFLRHKDNDED